MSEQAAMRRKRNVAEDDHVLAAEPILLFKVIYLAY